MYIRKDILSKSLDDIEGIFIEINLRKAVWFLQFICLLGKIKVLDVYREKYESMFLVDDFNTK